jgi:hypothetical protein
MKNKIVIFILLLISISKLNGQIFSKSPKNINHAIKILERKLSIRTKNNIESIASDSLLFLYKRSVDEFEVMDEWFYKWTRKSTTKDARLGKYYKRKGLKIPYDMIEIVLRSFQLKLRELPLNHDDLLKSFQLKQIKHNEEDKIRFTTDR